MDDGLVTPARAKLIDGYGSVREKTLDAGATGVTISGAGPAVLAVCHESDRRAVAVTMVDAFADEGVEAHAYQTRVGDGVTRYD
jgi:homoserine kinase